MCEHLNIEGDNYEETCMDCGEVLAGSGNCSHQWQPDGEDYEACLFCGEERIVEQA